MIDRGAEKRSALAIFNAMTRDWGPIAVAELSHHVTLGFHGNWRAIGQTRFRTKNSSARQTPMPVRKSPSADTKEESSRRLGSTGCVSADQ